MENSYTSRDVGLYGQRKRWFGKRLMDFLLGTIELIFLFRSSVYTAKVLRSKSRRSLKVVCYVEHTA